jgi:signal transduction histidine kinase
MRRRVQVLGVACLVAGWLLLPVVAVFTRWAVERSHMCTPPGTVLGLSSTTCAALAAYRPLVVVLADLLGVLVVALALVAASRWCLRPVRALAVPLSHVGPTNLGHRVRAGGDRDLAAVGDAVDAMMERITAGYEGQRRFAANASHELRTPLSVQRTLIEVGMTADATPEQLQLLARQLLATNERNERLIEGLLVLAESDQGLASRTPQRLDEVVADVLAAHADRAAAAGVTVTSELAPRTVVGERVLLERLVTNLVQNAITYNRPRGVLHVAVGQDPALVVTNSGDEVPAERIGELFEPFRRLSGTRIDHSGGSGLGLTIARSITSAHDGVIEAAPNSGGGLRVQVHLPAARTPAVAAAAPAEVPASA